MAVVCVGSVWWLHVMVLCGCSECASCLDYAKLFGSFLW